MITVYYDSECSFCFRTISRALKGCKVEIKLSTIQEIKSDEKQFQGISISELYRHMWLIDTNTGMTHRGYFAFKYIYTQLHRARAVKFMFLIPLLSDFFGVRIYRVIANNRRFAGCNSQGCSLHSKPDVA